MMFKWHKNIQNRQNLQSIISRKNFGILLILCLIFNLIAYSGGISGLKLEETLAKATGLSGSEEPPEGSNNGQRKTLKVEAKVGDLPKGTRYVLDVSKATGDVIILCDEEKGNGSIYKVSIDGGKTYETVEVDPQWGIVVTGSMPEGCSLKMGENSTKEEDSQNNTGETNTGENTQQNSENTGTVENSRNTNNSASTKDKTESKVASESNSTEDEAKRSGQTVQNAQKSAVTEKNRETLSDTTVTWNGYSSSETVTISGTVKIILADSSTNMASSGIVVLGESTLEIDSATGDGNYDGMGELIATGGNYGAGIGAGLAAHRDVGDITINGGTVTATAGSYGAGIGTGFNTESIGDITINGGTVTATGKNYGAGIGIGHGVNKMGNISISEDAKVFAIGGYMGIASATGSELSISNTASVVAVTTESSGPISIRPIYGTVSGTVPAMVGGYVRTSSDRVKPGDTVNIMESDGTILHTFEIPSDISVTEDTRMAITTAGSTGTKYIQAVRYGATILASKTSSVSNLEDYQYNSVQTTMPDMNELYLNSDTTNMNELDLTSIISAPTVNSGDTVLSLGNTATLTEGQINGLWEKTANSVTTWNESGGLFSNNHNLGTGNSVTITSLGVEGSTEITTTVSEVRLIGTSLVYQVTSPALTLTVENHVETVEDLGEYDLRYGNIEVMPEEGYAFKVNFRDEDGDKVEYFTSSKPITIYQSNGATTSTTNTITIGTTTNAVGNSTTPLSLTLGKIGMPVNIVATSTATKPCIGVIGNSNLKLILPDNIINTLDNSYGEGKTLSSSGDGTQVPCSAIQVAQVGSNRATLEIITAEGGSGNGKLIAKAGWDSAAIGGYKSGSSGYGGGNITITSGNIYASTTEYGGAAAIGAGSGGTNIAGNWGNIVINGGNITAIAKNYKKNSSTNSAIGGGWTKSLQDSVSGGAISISNDAKVLAVGEHAGIGSGINNESGTLSIASTAELVAICLQEVATSRPIIADLASGATYPSLVHGQIAASSATDQVAYNDKIKILDVSGNIQNEFIVPSHVTTAGYFSAKTSAESNYILAENGAGSGDIKTVAKNKTPSDTSAYEYDSQNASYNVENYDYLYFVSEIPTLSAPTLSSSTLLYGRSISASIGNLQGVNSSDWSIDNNSIRWSEAGEEDLVRDIVDANVIEPNGTEEGGQTYIVCTVVVHDNTAGSPFPLAVEITSERASLTVERKPIYNIQISWSSQNFTCTRDANGNWSWSNPSQINVENHSNVPIIVNYRYEADHRGGFYGVHGEFAQGNISLAKDNEDGQKSNTLTLFGRPFGLYIDEVYNLVGRSILSIVRDYGNS